MIREVKFESQDRRIKGIIEALNANGIKDIEEANAICDAAGLDPYKTCEETQPICFENARKAARMLLTLPKLSVSVCKLSVSRVL